MPVSPNAVSAAALRRGAREAAILAAALYLGAFLAWSALGRPGDAETIGDLALLPVDAFAIALAWRASVRCSGLPALSRFWMLFGVALAANLAGDIAMAVYDLGPSPAPFPSAADPLYVGFYAIAALALWRLPVASATPAQRRRMALDIATVVLGGGMAVWYLVLAPAILGGASTPLQMGFSIAYPLGDLVLLAAIGLIALRWTPLAAHRSLAWVGAGLAFFIAADLVYGYAQLHGGYRAGGPTDALWIAAMALWAIAALEQRPVRSGDAAAGIPSRPPVEARASLLPLAALAVGSAILLAAEWKLPLVPDLGLIAIAVAAAAVIAVRQHLAQADLLRADAELRAARDELARLASHDPLTGLPNRRSLNGAVAAELARARRYDRPLSVLYVDLDRFKSINDDLGHEAGDDVLCEFADTLSGCLRPTDLPGRWGGEEFVVVLPETGPHDARLAAERIRSAVERRDFAFAGKARVTCSIGVSTFPADGADARSLFRAADDAAYAAKREGRNRVVVAAAVPS